MKLSIIFIILKQLNSEGTELEDLAIFQVAEETRKILTHRVANCLSAIFLNARNTPSASNSAAVKSSGPLLAFWALNTTLAITSSESDTFEYRKLSATDPEIDFRPVVTQVRPSSSFQIPLSL